MRIGDVLSGRFRIDTELSGSAAGVVYGAHDLVLDRKVALKPIALEDVTVFRTTQVDRVFEIVTAGDRAWAVMEHPRQRRKSKRVSRRRPFLLGLAFALVAFAFVGVGVYETTREGVRLLPANRRFGIDATPGDLVVPATAAAPSSSPNVVEVHAAAKPKTYATTAILEWYSTDLTFDAAHTWFEAHHAELNECVQQSRCELETKFQVGWAGNSPIANAPPYKCTAGNFEQCLVNLLRHDARGWPAGTCETDAATCNSYLRLTMQ